MTKAIPAALQTALEKEVTTFNTCWWLGLNYRNPKITAIQTGIATRLTFETSPRIRVGDFVILKGVRGLHSPSSAAFGKGPDDLSELNDDAHQITWRVHTVIAIHDPLTIFINANTEGFTEYEGGGIMREVFGYTDALHPIVLDNMVYDADLSYQPTSAETSADGAVDTMSIQGFMPKIGGRQRFTEGDIESGRYDNAELRVFRINVCSPHDGRIWHRRGYLGEIQIGNEQYEAEVRSLLTVIGQPTLQLFSADCRHQFGDANCGVDEGEQCADVVVETTRQDLVVGELHQAHPRETGNTFRDPIPQDWFAYGRLKFITGLNAGLERPIETAVPSALDSSFEPLALDPFPEGADDFTVIQWEQQFNQVSAELCDAARRDVNHRTDEPIVCEWPVPRVDYPDLPDSFRFRFLQPPVRVWVDRADPMAMRMGVNPDTLFGRDLQAGGFGDNQGGELFVIRIQEINYSGSELFRLGNPYDTGSHFVVRRATLCRPPCVPPTGYNSEDTERRLELERDMWDKAPFRYTTNVDGVIVRESCVDDACDAPGLRSTQVITMAEVARAFYSGRDKMVVRYNPDGTYDALSDFYRYDFEAPVFVTHQEIEQAKVLPSIPIPPAPVAPENPGPLRVEPETNENTETLIPRRLQEFGTILTRSTSSSLDIALEIRDDGPPPDPATINGRNGEPEEDVIVLDFTNFVNQTQDETNDLKTLRFANRFASPLPETFGAYNSVMYTNGIYRPDMLFPSGVSVNLLLGHARAAVADGRPYCAIWIRSGFPTMFSPFTTAEEVQRFVEAPPASDAPDAPPILANWIRVQEGGINFLQTDDDDSFNTVAGLGLYGVFAHAPTSTSHNVNSLSAAQFRFRNTEGEELVYNIDYDTFRADVGSFSTPSTNGITLGSSLIPSNMGQYRVLAHPTDTTPGILAVLESESSLLHTNVVTAPPAELAAVIAANTGAVAEPVGATQEEIDQYRLDLLAFNNAQREFEAARAQQQALLDNLPRVSLTVNSTATVMSSGAPENPGEVGDNVDPDLPNIHNTHVRNAGQQLLVDHLEGTTTTAILNIGTSIVDLVLNTSGWTEAFRNLYAGQQVDINRNTVAPDFNGSVSNTQDLFEADGVTPVRYNDPRLMDGVVLRVMFGPGTSRTALLLAINPTRNEGTTQADIDAYLLALEQFQANPTPISLFANEIGTTFLGALTNDYNDELLETVAEGDLYDVVAIRFDASYEGTFTLVIKDGPDAYLYRLLQPWNGESVTSEFEGVCFRIDKLAEPNGEAGELQILDDRRPANDGFYINPAPECFKQLAPFTGEIPEAPTLAGDKTLVDFDGLAIGAEPSGFTEAQFPYDGAELSDPFVVSDGNTFDSPYAVIAIGQGSRYYAFTDDEPQTDSAVQTDVYATEDDVNRQPSIILRCQTGHECLELRWANEWNFLELYDVDIAQAVHHLRARVVVPPQPTPGVYRLFLQAQGTTARFSLRSVLDDSIIVQGSGSTLTTVGFSGVGVTVSEA